MNTTKKLLIVAGAAGEIGTEYCKKAIENGIDCIGVVRNKKTGLVSPFFTEVLCHLDSEQSIQETFGAVDFTKYEEVIYLHTIGVDKFDPRVYPNIRPLETIPADIYNTNVNSFKYLLRYCAARIADLNEMKSNKIKFKVAIIAGVADKHSPFVIESFCEAKFILRGYISSYISLYTDWVSGLSINITSTITKSALGVRPFADTTYWLQPYEVANESFKELIARSKKYKEIDIIKHNPNFVPGYYESNKALYEKWSTETGIK